MATKEIDEYQYKQTDVLGQGSFGQVFKGTKTTTGEVVAVKMLNRKTIDSDEYLRQALFSEVAFMQQLSSQYIVNFLNLIETNNNYYIILEFCGEGDLQHSLNKQSNKQFDEERAISIMCDIFSGYKELLKNGITHRDIKPANIMIKNGIHKLADFGFAKQMDYAVKANNLKAQSRVGTPLYMSP